MRLGEDVAPAALPPGVRVILDLRPLRDPERAPVTVAYLRGLLGAYAAEPLAGESLIVLLDAGGGDPTGAFPGLALAGRRRLPPTRFLRSAALALDPFLVRGAALGTGFRARGAGAAGVVAHAVAGALPIGPGIPTVATILDLAPWELPDLYQRSPAARFGRRLRGRLLRDAAAVIVGTEAVGRLARRLLRVRADRLRVIALAGNEACAPLPAGDAGTDARARLAAERERLGLPERYLVYTGRYDARQDLPTLLAALGRLAAAGRPPRLARHIAWPPRILLVGASPDDRAGLARAAGAAGLGELLAYAPGTDAARTALLVAGARAALVPTRSDAAALPALDALAAGTPVVASAVGALPEVVGTAGILVEPGDPDRMAAALRAAWADDRIHDRLVAIAAERAAGRRTWSDVARETRRVYADVATGSRRSAQPR